MTQSFRHSKNEGGDAFVAISNNDTEVLYPYAWWITQEPGYSLPSPYVYREYVKGSYHKLHTNNTEYDGEFPYLNGDIYIAKKADYDIAYAAYINTPPSLEIAKEQKINELLAKLIEVRQSKVIYNTATYKSDEIRYQRLFTESLQFTNLGDVPINYYVLDDNFDEINLTLVQLQALVAKIQDLYYQCWLTYDIHHLAINACTTIEQVQDYDILTGWPIVPYNP